MDVLEKVYKRVGNPLGGTKALLGTMVFLQAMSLYNQSESCVSMSVGLQDCLLFLMLFGQDPKAQLGRAKCQFG